MASSKGSSGSAAQLPFIVVAVAALAVTLAYAFYSTNGGDGDISGGDDDDDGAKTQGQQQQKQRGIGGNADDVVVLTDDKQESEEEEEEEEASITTVIIQKERSESDATPRMTNKTYLEAAAATITSSSASAAALVNDDDDEVETTKEEEFEPPLVVVDPTEAELEASILEVEASPTSLSAEQEEHIVTLEKVVDVVVVTDDDAAKLAAEAAVAEIQLEKVEDVVVAATNDAAIAKQTAEEGEAAAAAAEIPEVKTHNNTAPVESKVEKKKKKSKKVRPKLTPASNEPARDEENEGLFGDVATNAVVATTATIPSDNTTTKNTQSSTKPISSLGKHKLSSSNQVVPTPKSKPTTLSNNDDAESEIKLPEEGADYPLISSYWKQKENKNSFVAPAFGNSPQSNKGSTDKLLPSLEGVNADLNVDEKEDGNPVEKEEPITAAELDNDDANTTEVANNGSAPDFVDETVAENIVQEEEARGDSINEEIAATDSATGSAADDKATNDAESTSFDNETTKIDGGVSRDATPQEEDEVVVSKDKKEVTDDKENSIEEEDGIDRKDSTSESSSSDPQLIVPSASYDSSGDGSMESKGSSQDYVKIVKTSKGEAMTESEFFSRPVVEAPRLLDGGEEVDETDGGGGAKGHDVGGDDTEDAVAVTEGSLSREDESDAENEGAAKDVVPVPQQQPESLEGTVSAEQKPKTTHADVDPQEARESNEEDMKPLEDSTVNAGEATAAVEASSEEDAPAASASEADANTSISGNTNSNKKKNNKKKKKKKGKRK